MSWEQRVNGLQFLTTGSISQWAAETLIWDPFWFTEFRKNTYNPEQVILHTGGLGFLAVSEDAGKNWDDRTAYVEQNGPPNSWGDTPAPTMNDVIVKQIHGDIHKLGRFCAIAQLATGTATDARGWLMVTDNDWFTTEWLGLNSFNPETAPNWGLTPSNTYQSFSAQSGGAQGSGVVKNNGDEFTIDSVLGSDGGLDIYIISLITDGFLISQAGDTSLTTEPPGTIGGSIQVVSGLPIAAQGAHGQTATACGQTLTAAGSGKGMGANGIGSNRQFVQWWHTKPNGSFSLTLKIVTPPTTCEASLPGSLPLALDIDNETGLRCYVTTWQNGSLVLQNWDVTTTTPALSSTYILDTVTISEVEQFTKYAVPFCLADPNVSGYGNVIYVFGFFDDKHLVKSTDGGATFGANLGDVSWATDRVSAFMALDENTFYAFVKTATSQSDLWRSLDGGATWVKIQSALPVAPEHQAISRHASGALLVGNSDTGPVQAIYLASPYESQYVDASGAGGGRLPNQSGGPGGGLSSIIWVT